MSITMICLDTPALRCIEDAKSFCRHFFDWSPCRDRPDDPRPGALRQANVVPAARQLTLDQAFHDNPDCFVNKPPTPPDKPTVAGINPPTPKPARRT
jgi:putative transposase